MGLVVTASVPPPRSSNLSSAFLVAILSRCHRQWGPITGPEPCPDLQEQCLYSSWNYSVCTRSCFLPGVMHLVPEKPEKQIGARGWGHSLPSLHSSESLVYLRCSYVCCLPSPAQLRSPCTLGYSFMICPNPAFSYTKSRKAPACLVMVMGWQHIGCK